MKMPHQNTEGAACCPFCGSQPFIDSEGEWKDDRRYYELKLHCGGCEVEIVDTISWAEMRDNYDIHNLAPVRAAAGLARAHQRMAEVLLARWNERELDEQGAERAQKALEEWFMEQLGVDMEIPEYQKLTHAIINAYLNKKEEE